MLYTVNFWKEQLLLLLGSAAFGARYFWGSLLLEKEAEPFFHFHVTTIVGELLMFTTCQF